MIRTMGVTMKTNYPTVLHIWTITPKIFSGTKTLPFLKNWLFIWSITLRTMLAGSKLKMSISLGLNQKFKRPTLCKYSIRLSRPFSWTQRGNLVTLKWATLKCGGMNKVKRWRKKSRNWSKMDNLNYCLEAMFKMTKRVPHTKTSFWTCQSAISLFKKNSVSGPGLDGS